MDGEEPYDGCLLDSFSRYIDALAVGAG